MEYVKIQLSKNNIKRVKEINSFAKVINTLIEMTNDENILKQLLDNINKKDNK